MSHRILAIIIIIILFSGFTAYGQTAESKVAQETQEIEKFIDSFIQNYKQTFDLTEVHKSFFVANYKTINSPHFFRGDLENSFTSDENFRNYSSLLDLLSLTLLTELDENNYDLNKTFKKGEKINEEYDFFSKREHLTLQKYPKAALFMHRTDISQIKNVTDYRNAIQEFHKFVQEIRKLVDEKQKDRFLKFRREFKANFFKILYSVECSKKNTDCKELPEKTKMFWCEDIPFYLLIAKDKGQLKIVKIQPPTD